jgi:hypothetical protein
MGCAAQQLIQGINFLQQRKRPTLLRNQTYAVTIIDNGSKPHQISPHVDRRDLTPLKTLRRIHDPTCRVSKTIANKRLPQSLDHFTAPPQIAGLTHTFANVILTAA